jgi:hypothetical protein
MKKILENKILQIIEFFGIAVIPVTVIEARLVPFTEMGLLSVLTTTFIVVSGLISLRIYCKMWSFREIGFTFTNIRKGLPAYSLLLLVVCCLFITAPYAVKTRSEFNLKYFFLFNLNQLFLV